METLSSAPTVAVATGLAVLGLALVLLSRVYWRWRLTRWAAGEGLRLVSFRGAASFEGPGKFMRSENQSLFRVEVADSSGRTRGGWVMFGSYWGFALGEPISEVTWD